MIATLVFIEVKPEYVEDFRAVTVYNHENARKEPGNVRFDVLQDSKEPTHFVLYEVYRDQEAVDFHKTTAHYKRWREEVAPYMAVPRRSVVTTPVSFD